MEEEYIDIANMQRQYELALARLVKDSSISDRNKQLVRSFLRDAALGKTIAGKAKKKIGHAALVGYLSHLCTFMLFVKKDLDQMTDEAMEEYIEALENDVIRSRARRLVGKRLGQSGVRYSPRYKVDNKVVIRKFYRWLWGENKYYPKIVEWFDTYAKDTEVSALTEADSTTTQSSTPQEPNPVAGETNPDSPTPWARAAIFAGPTFASVARMTTEELRVSALCRVTNLS